jgi:hypothetical protein
MSSAVRNDAMDLFQSFVFDAVWFFFGAWGTALAALAVITFKPDILAMVHHSNAQSSRRQPAP